ncbi:inhibitor of KinA [Lishizhenia tianjinensis]|uniref:Inhibitor of KinA n=1 Tax=Lishizhenia tianjinensis TaxID=477690 RepID=A0A1I7B9V2_9FLAO|nr:5-oxoprolinase subunit PxpB [Lishizhenia tianjinensis]SFT83871.1 inhibitor of KinA [Lishizhenia tianjinensis]
MKVSCKRYGSHGLLLTWPNEIKESILMEVLNFQNALQEKYEKRLAFTQNAYNSILLQFLEEPSAEDEKEILFFVNESVLDLGLKNRQTWYIPVCYEKPYALDMPEVCLKNGLSKEEVIELHTSSTYLVYFMGFLPGFCYLGGLDEKLHIPRKAIPRKITPRGAVGLGGQQTGIYPVESPGGWNIIGNTPVDMLQLNLREENGIQPGDYLKFIAVSPQEFEFIKKEADQQNYKLKSVPC